MIARSKSGKTVSLWKVLADIEDEVEDEDEDEVENEDELERAR